MTFDKSLFEEVWVESQDALEALKSDAPHGYDEQLLVDAFIAGMVTAIVVLGNKACDELEGRK